MVCARFRRSHVSFKLGQALAEDRGAGFARHGASAVQGRGRPRSGLDILVHELENRERNPLLPGVTAFIFGKLTQPKGEAFVLRFQL